ncbi:hypothetical protein BDP81DRAFT_434766 [Colletotrichum phormii]|uniref:Uncharacterized protein n=1 Tax=Colletotrichum phormii TaxID=359342 RepID=A0AAJ0EDR9_9PEZI|nr:uncharacterized protein BDP81DRAFT_434766 [Colletotrichum phormii]KAK1633371.1 hypothetical protein BDP81DRAFT_434766 [Colletotrichum phormii]
MLYSSPAAFTLRLIPLHHMQTTCIIAAAAPIKPVGRVADQILCSLSHCHWHTAQTPAKSGPRCDRSKACPLVPRAGSWNCIPSPTRFELALQKYKIRTRCRNRTCGTSKVRDSTVDSSSCNTVCLLDSSVVSVRASAPGPPESSKENCSEPTCELPTTTDRIWAPPNTESEGTFVETYFITTRYVVLASFKALLFSSFPVCRTRMPLRQRHASLEPGWPTGCAGEITPHEAWPRSWRP